MKRENLETVEPKGTRTQKKVAYGSPREPQNGTKNGAPSSDDHGQGGISSRDQALGLVERFGTHGIAQSSVMGNSELFFSHDRSGFIAYRITSDIALALGSPVASTSSIPAIAGAFLGAARSRHLAGVAFFEANRDVATALRDVGFSAIAMGAEPIVRLSSFDLQGRARKSLRQAYNRGKREGIEVIEYRPDRARCVDWEAEIGGLEASWLDAHGGQSIQAFTDISLDFARGIAPGRLFLALHQGHVVAMSLLCPAPACHGWNMHLARRRPDAPRGTMEVLDVETLGMLKNEHAQAVSFGFCPLEHVPPGESHPLVMQAFKFAARRAVGNYNAVGIAAYKKKFAPDIWEPRYLVFAPPRAIRKVVLAVIRAEVPGGLQALAKMLTKSAPTRAA